MRRSSVLSLPLQLVFPGSSLDGNGKEKSDFCSVSFDFLNLLVSTIFEIAGTAHFLVITDNRWSHCKGITFYNAIRDDISTKKLKRKN